MLMNGDNMDFKLIKTFLKVSELNSFTAAANLLGYAQSTVTAQIKLLEKELHTILFERIGKSISLTADGKAFIPYAKQLVYLERDINNNFGTTSVRDGHLIIGTSQSLCNTIVPHIIRDYQQQYPNVTIQIVLDDSCAFPEMLRNNEIDLAFSIGKQPDNSDFISFYCKEEKICFFASPDHPLAQKSSITLDILCQYPLLLTAQGCKYRAALLKNAQENSTSLNIILESDNIQLLKKFAMNRLGITFLPYIAVEESLSKGELIELFWKGEAFHIPSEVLYHKDKHISPALRNFLNITKEILSANS